MGRAEQFSASLNEADSSVGQDVRAYLDWLAEQLPAGYQPGDAVARLYLLINLMDNE